MDKVYSRINWQNQPSTTTALGATNLNKMDLALNEIDNRVVAMDTSKANLSTVNAMVKDITLDSDGVITITYQNGTTSTYDTKLEKIAVNFEYDAETESLIITLDDGTEQTIDLSSLITEYEFENSDTIGFSIDGDGTVTADVIDGSITGDKLQPDYLADITVQAGIATTQAALAKRYAVGGVVEGDATDNAKYYKEKAEEAAAEAEEIVGFDPTTKLNKANADTATEGQVLTSNGDDTYEFKDPPGGGTAEDITYDNTESGLVAEDVQGAIDEVGSQLASIENDFISVIALGAKGNANYYNAEDGMWYEDDTYTVLAQDDTEILNSAFATYKRVYVPPLGYRVVTNPVIIAQNGIDILGHGARLRPDKGTLITAIVGGISQPSNMKIDISAEAGEYDDTTENVGFLHLEYNQSALSNMEARYFKYPHKWEPTTAANAYNTFTNLQGIGGKYNFTLKPLGSAWVNENTFIGGRGFCTTDTVRNLYMDNTDAQVDHNRFIGMSLEGQGECAIFCNGTNNVFEFPRTEGVWSVEPIVFGEGSSLNMLISSRLDVSIDDSGNRNQYISYASGTRMVTGTNERNTLQVSRGGSNTVLPRTGIAITGVSKGNPCVVTAPSHGLANNNFIRIVGVGGMKEINNRFFKITNVTTDTFELLFPKLVRNRSIDSTNFTNYTGGGAIITGIPASLVEDLGTSGNSLLTDYYHAIDSSNSYVFRSIRLAGGLLRSALTTDGKMFVEKQYKTNQFSWVFSPIVLGPYHLWVTSAGKLMIKNGAPTSETDGTVVGTQS